jgi:hypothetical protein
VQPATRWWLNGTILLASGGAVLAASLGTGLAADSIHKDLLGKCDADKVCDPSLKSKVNEGQSLAIASDVLLGVGAAAAVTGLVVMLVQRYHHASAHARALPTPTGVRVSF